MNRTDMESRVGSFSKTVYPAKSMKAAIPSSGAVVSEASVRPRGINLLAYFDVVLYPKLLVLSFIGMMFGNTIDLAKQIQDVNESSLSFQVLYKLGFMSIGLIVAFWGWWFRPQVRYIFSTAPGLMLLALAGWHLVTIPMAYIPSKALIAFFSFVASLFVSVNTLVEFGLKKTLIAAIVSLFLYSIVSVGLYFVSPELATFREVMSDVVTVERFGGLSHPNVLGRYSVLTVLLAGVAVRLGYLNWKWFLFVGLISVAVLIASLSRTPVIAGVAAAGIVFLPMVRRTQMVLAAALGSLAIMVGFLVIEGSMGFDVVVERLIQKTTKTGSAEEITTGTGRTDIWAYSITKTAERPIFGWGIGSTALVMEERSGHSHNLLLHPALALGLPGMAMVLFILLYNIRAAINTRNLVLSVVLLYILVLGLVESPLLGSFPDSVCMLWFIITLLPIVLVWERESALQAT